MWLRAVGTVFDRASKRGRLNVRHNASHDIASMDILSTFLLSCQIFVQAVRKPLSRGHSSFQIFIQAQRQTVKRYIHDLNYVCTTYIAGSHSIKSPRNLWSTLIHKICRKDTVQKTRYSCLCSLYLEM
jgi:hypothetical protein